MVMYINNKNSDTDSTVSGLKVSLSLPLIRSPTEQFAAGQEKSGQEQGESLLHTGQGAHKGEQGGRDGGLLRLQAVRLLLRLLLLQLLVLGPRSPRCNIRVYW